MELGLKPIVVINKIDKATSRPDWVIDRLFDLFISLGATDEQAEFTVVYAIAKQGIAIKNIGDEQKDISPLFQTIIDLVQPAPKLDNEPLQMQVANLGYDDFLGRLGIWRITQGTIKAAQQVTVIDNEGVRRTGKVSKIFVTSGLSRVETLVGTCGDIVTIAGIPNIYVGETITDNPNTEALPPITIDEPTLTMEFVVNDSPFMGKEGKFVTSRNLFERLTKELEVNVGLKIDFSDPTKFVVSGRGELHLWVLIETMRREWYELQVSAPEVITKRDENGHKLEPFEILVITVDESVSGSIIQLISDRKGLMQTMNTDYGQTTIEFEIPTRGLLGLKGDFILLTKGEGLMFHSFSHFAPWAWEIAKRRVGSINKQMTNVRNAGNDEAMRLEPIRHMTLEDALWYIANDEYVEITPKSIRLRKKYLTDSARASARKK